MFSIEEGEAIENTIQHKWSTFCRLLFVVKFEIGGGRYRPRSSSNSSRGRGRRRTITNDENKKKRRIDLETALSSLSAIKDISESRKGRGQGT